MTSVRVRIPALSFEPCTFRSRLSFIKDIVPVPLDVLDDQFGAADMRATANAASGDGVLT